MTAAQRTPGLSRTQRMALRFASRDGILCEPELYLECDAGGLTVHNIRRSVEALVARGLLSTNEYGDRIITDAGREALAKARAALQSTATTQGAVNALDASCQTNGVRMEDDPHYQAAQAKLAAGTHGLCQNCQAMNPVNSLCRNCGSLVRL